MMDFTLIDVAIHQRCTVPSFSLRGAEGEAYRACLRSLVMSMDEKIDLDISFAVLNALLATLLLVCCLSFTVKSYKLPTLSHCPPFRYSINFHSFGGHQSVEITLLPSSAVKCQSHASSYNRFGYLLLNRLRLIF